MIKIGLTGSVASGKTTASKIIAKGRGPLFSADKVVKKLYTKNRFKKFIAKKVSLKVDKNFKEKLKNKILEKKENLRKLERIIHPLVRKEMLIFFKKNKNKKFLFLEIPLLIESKLTKYCHRATSIAQAFKHKKIKNNRWPLRRHNIGSRVIKL